MRIEDDSAQEQEDAANRAASVEGAIERVYNVLPSGYNKPQLIAALNRLRKAEREETLENVAILMENDIESLHKRASRCGEEAGERHIMIADHVETLVERVRDPVKSLAMREIDHESC